MDNNNNNFPDGMNTAYLDQLFNGMAGTFEKGSECVNRISNAIDNVGRPSSNNWGYVGGNTQPVSYGYGYASREAVNPGVPPTPEMFNRMSSGGFNMQNGGYNNPQPVKYGYGYGNKSPFGNFEGPMANTDYDGIKNPNYGKVDYMNGGGPVNYGWRI